MANRPIPEHKRRKAIGVTLAPEVLEALEGRAARDGLPVSRTLDTIIRRALRVPVAGLEPEGRAA